MEESEIQRHASVSPATLRTLIDLRLVRAEQTPEGTYYELSHDSLINPVLASSRWQLRSRAFWYLGSGFVYVTCVLVSFAFGVYFSFLSSKQTGIDRYLDIIVSALFYVIAWVFWRGGIHNRKNFQDNRRRSRITVNNWRDGVSKGGFINGPSSLRTEPRLQVW
jgi:hypothetical protein